jgi:glycosyltransferase involved in cell wall biosynthesis
MAHGLPAIGFENCAGVSDLIVHNKTGLLAKGGDNPKDLSSVMDALMRNDEARASMGRAAQEKTKEFTPAPVYDKWEQLFTNLAKG